ncbi:MAG: OmpA family protein [Deltaproteobacteria bacterium]|nr:OmpA family protein [Deltaproteobacteria bacterium]
MIILAYISALILRLCSASVCGAGAVVRLCAGGFGPGASLCFTNAYNGKTGLSAALSARAAGLRPFVSCLFENALSLNVLSVLTKPLCCVSRIIAARTLPVSAARVALPVIASIVLLVLSTGARAATVPGTNISNAAQAAYSPNGIGAVTAASNTVSLTSVVYNMPAKIEFMKYAPLMPGAEMDKVYIPDYITQSGAPWPMPLPWAAGTTVPLDIANPIPLVDANFYQESEPVFIKLTDHDYDGAGFVSVTLTVDTNPGEFEELRLKESDMPGVFIGYSRLVTWAPLNKPHNGLLSISSRSIIKVAYVDQLDGTDTAAAAALIDPYGLVFDTSTGEPVNGAVVTLIDATTGLPALVHGDNGVSVFPSTVTTGGSARDSYGKSYIFAKGEYRFPFVSAGQYRILVAPPNGYRSPSQVGTAWIQTLPGAPYAMAEPGSRGEVFIISPGPAIHIDLPVDPVVRLYLTKAASKTTVSPGDFLQYKLMLEDAAGGPVLTGVTISDKLPLGFRYRKGSARLDGAKTADPDISADGRTLTFNVGTMPVKGKINISYVAEVGAVARLGNATNTAQAVAAGGHLSNVAKAVVLVKEDLFISKTVIVGRVAADSCGEREGVSLAGIRVYLEDGANAVTDKNGMYHFEGVNPGTHVVQLDLATVPDGYEVTACEENTRFAGSMHSQFVDLQPGALWRADFTFVTKPEEPVEKPLTAPIETKVESVGGVGIELKGALREDEPVNGAAPESGEKAVGTADYSVAIGVDKAPLQNLRLMVVLPEGVRYIPGTSRLGSSGLADPEITENVLTYRLGDEPADWSGEAAFAASVDVDGDAGEFATKALLIFDTADMKNRRTQLADTTMKRVLKDKETAIEDITLRPHFKEVSAAIEAEDIGMLDELIAKLGKARVEHITVIGHTDSNRIRKRSLRLFNDNYSLSKGRAASIAKYIADALQLDPSRVTVDGKGPDEPVATNATERGRAMNRRVELVVQADRAIKWHELENGKVASGPLQTEFAVSVAREYAGAQAGPAAGDSAANMGERPVAGTSMPDYDMDWLDSARPGLEWLWPYAGYNPSIQAIKIAIKHDPTKTLTLYLNGEPVNPVALDKVIKRGDGLAALSLWRGVNIVEGYNMFDVVESVDGVETARVRKVVHYSGAPVKAVIMPEASMLVADGKSSPVVAVRLIDKDEKPAREGVVGEFAVDAPYLAQKRLDYLQESPLAESRSERERYQVGDDGIALIELQPTTQTGEAVVRFYLAGGEKEIHVWLQPDMRDWILVGLAEGTAGYDAVTGNMESFGETGGNQDLYEDGRVAFFAKGQVKEDWLLTIAYDNEKNGRGRDNQSLHQTIDPDTYYTVYGDASGQRYDAASARNIYVKVERERFYALFGDYETGLTVTELAKYNRNFNGLKSEYMGEHAQWNVFVSDTNQAFKRDELRGDGTSGIYRLSRRNIIMNSETVTIETRDRFHSEVVISSVRLTRHLDYNIDYDSGTIDFRTPIYGRDDNLNPVYIVAEYESNDAASDMSYNYGGRGAVRLLDNALETGVSLIHEGGVGGKADLSGVDATVNIDDKTKFRAEYAETKTDRYNSVLEGNAFLAEMTHKYESYEDKVYVRQQTQEFGIGQQKGSEAGMSKYGYDGAYRLAAGTSLNAQVYRQNTVSTDATRDVLELRAKHYNGPYDTHLGLRHASDTFAGGPDNNSDQLLAGARYRLLDDKLALRLDREQSVGSNNESGDFPTRTIAGVDYKLAPTATVALEHEITSGQSESAETTRLGLRASPWTGAQMSSSVGQEHTEAGQRVFSSSGLKQTWQVTERLSLDAGLDRSITHKHPGNAQVNNNAPAASGAGHDYTAVSAGAAYREKKWAVTSRVEVREAKGDDKTGLAFGANGELSEGLALLAGLRLNRTVIAAGEKNKDANLRLGAAWRPKNTRLIMLDRLDLIMEDHKGGAFTYHNQRYINNLNLNYKIETRAQLSFQYGAKYVRETIDREDYAGYIDVLGIETRYDVTKKWDVGARLLALHSWSANQYKYGSGASVGYNFAKNVWLSVGYNFTGFRDKDFSKADFTAKGPFVKFRMKFDQETVREAVKWVGGQ